MIWWTWMDLPGYWGENGLLTAQGVQKPAYTALSVAASKLSQARFVREVPSGETGSSTARIYELSGARRFYVGWVEGATSASVTLPGGRFALIDPMGMVQGYASDGSDGKNDGLVHIVLGPEPRYMERVN
jgi:hypothetical protein